VIQYTRPKTYINREDRVRSPIATPFVFFLSCAAAVAQPSSNGYLVAGAGVRDAKAISEAAVGGEWVIGKGVGVGGEVGAVAGHETFGFLSANGYYHLTRQGRFDPFVTAGYTLGFSVFGGAGSAFNAGGGINFWLWRRLGLRAEFRDIVAHGDPSPNFWVFRGGILFR
jgi:hypothetical protein